LLKDLAVVASKANNPPAQQQSNLHPGHQLEGLARKSIPASSSSWSVVPPCNRAVIESAGRHTRDSCPPPAAMMQSLRVFQVGSLRLPPSRLSPSSSPALEPEQSDDAVASDGGGSVEGWGRIGPRAHCLRTALVQRLSPSASPTATPRGGPPTPADPPPATAAIDRGFIDADAPVVEGPLRASRAPPASDPGPAPAGATRAAWAVERPLEAPPVTDFAATTSLQPSTAFSTLPGSPPPPATTTRAAAADAADNGRALPWRAACAARRSPTPRAAAAPVGKAGPWLAGAGGVEAQGSGSAGMGGGDRDSPKGGTESRRHDDGGDDSCDRRVINARQSSIVTATVYAV
jgi:hypothetical protein